MELVSCVKSLEQNIMSVLDGFRMVSMQAIATPIDES